MNKLILFALLALPVFLTGCKKYEDGPLMSLYSKGMRVNGTWYFQNVMYDGKDSTEHYPYHQFSFYFMKKTEGGSFVWNHNIRTQPLNEDMYQTGLWRFISDRDSFEMITYKNQFRDSVITKWKINRLAYTEFWIERTIRDTISLKWQLVKYVY
jgi:hypothetical protein